MINPKILYLNQRDIAKLINIKSVLSVVEEAFRHHGQGNVQMPPKMYLDFPEHNGDLRIMPVERSGLDVSGVKIVNVHPDNFQYDLPTVMATILLNSVDTGQPLAFMEAGLITDLRTGAAGAVAAKYLSRKDSKVVGIIGLGNQARTQLEALMLVRDIKTIKIYDKDLPTQELFMEWVKEKFGMPVFIGNLEYVCDCDILVTTTPSRKPIVNMFWVNPGTHINAIGADAKGKQELDPLLLKHAKIVVDDWIQASHSGEINIPISTRWLSKADIYITLGEIVCGKNVGRENNEEITIFDSTGLAIQDLATATLVYKKAIEQGIGLKLPLF